MLRDRKTFIRQLVNYLRRDRHIIYMDQTTTNLNDFNQYTWQVSPN